MKNSSRLFALVITAVLIVMVISSVVVGFYTDWLWFDHVGYGSVFWTRFSTEVTARAAAAIFGGIIVFANLWIVTRQLGPVHVRRRYGNQEISEQIPRNMVRIGMLLASVLAGWWLSGVKFSGAQSLAILTWLKKTPWGQTDPLFGNDISFYVFTLPVMYQMVEFLMLVALWSLVL